MSEKRGTSSPMRRKVRAGAMLIRMRIVQVYHRPLRFEDLKPCEFNMFSGYFEELAPPSCCGGGFDGQMTGGDDMFGRGPSNDPAPFHREIFVGDQLNSWVWPGRFAVPCANYPA